MHPDELEQWANRRLRAQPPLRAPRTLLPRVMQAVHSVAGQPWYARTWFSWPVAGQALSVGIVLSMVIGYVWMAPALHQSVDGATTRLTSQVLAPFSGVLEEIAKVRVAARVVWQSALQPVVAALFVLVVLMCAACAAFGAALDRVALGGPSQP